MTFTLVKSHSQSVDKSLLKICDKPCSKKENIYYDSFFIGKRERVKKKGGGNK